MWEEKDYLGLYRVQAGSVTFLGTLYADSFGFFEEKGQKLASKQQLRPSSSQVFAR